MRITAPTIDWLMKNHCPSAPSSHLRVKDLVSLLKWKKSRLNLKGTRNASITSSQSNSESCWAQAVLQGHWHSMPGKISKAIEKLPNLPLQSLGWGCHAHSWSRTKVSSFGPPPPRQALPRPLGNIHRLPKHLQKTGSANTVHFCLPLA